MRWIIIAGSQRSQSQSLKVANFLAEMAAGLSSEISLEVVDLHQIKLPFFHQETNSDFQSSQLLDLKKKLKLADGFIFVTPEWGGMATPILKNLFLMLGNDQLAFKPALLVSVSASRGGAYPVAELRMSSYKNNRVAYLPEHLIVRSVEKVMNQQLDLNLEQTAENKEDWYIQQRAKYCLELLILHTQNYSKISRGGLDLINKYQFFNGM